MNRRQKCVCLALIGFSLLIFIRLAAFEGGHSVTPYGTTDSKGFVLGFNNKVTPELFSMMFANSTLKNSVRAVGVYGIVLLAMHMLGLGLVLLEGSNRAQRLRRGFFLVQFVLFPTAIFGLLFGSLAALSVVNGTVDDETISDGIPMWWSAQIFWLLACATISFVQRHAQREHGVESESHLSLVKS